MGLLKKPGLPLRYATLALLALCSVRAARAQQLEGLTPMPAQTVVIQVPAPEPVQHNGPMAQRYRALRSVALDPAKVYHVREASIDRDELHLFLTDGTIAFTQSIEGRTTGAFFYGEGEVLMRPPDLTEHASLGLFSGLGVLNETFGAAYLRFNGDLESELKPYLRESEDADEFLQKYADHARELSKLDGLRLLESFTEDESLAATDHLLHARIATRAGNLDVVYDSLSEDRFSVSSIGESGDRSYLDMWMAFPGRAALAEGTTRVIDPERSAAAVSVESFHIDATLMPPEMMEASAELDLDVHQGGQRLLIFELSRWLRVRSVTVDGSEVEFLQNEALNGSELERVGNDLVTIVLPAPLGAGEHHHASFRYAGPVMQQAAPGLLYVGARGTWYPNRGMQMSKYELTFHWPVSWTLVATGRQVQQQDEGKTHTGRWVADQKIPMAGFNLGKFLRADAKLENIDLASYSAGVLEGVQAQAVAAELHAQSAERNQAVALQAAATIARYQQWFGPYPYKSLAITQLPGTLSQGWPTLVFLTSYAYLTEDEMKTLARTPIERRLYRGFVLDHEIAHQWWGDRVGWKNYRDQWLMEALANMSALMLLEEQSPEKARELLEQYRQELLVTNGAGKRYADAGPVTLGYRLSSSVFPDAYIPVTYGRGLWLMVMLRDYFADYEHASGNGRDGGRFLAALREFQRRYAQSTVTTDDFRAVLEEFLPPTALFEGKRSLEWFFEEWVRGSSVPRIAIEKLAIKRGASPVATFNLVQKDCPESLVTAVPIFAETADGQKAYVGRAFADGAETRIEMKVPVGTERLLADPDRKLLRAD